jgi:hypothetical protein
MEPPYHRGSDQIAPSTTPFVPANGWADPRSPYQAFAMLMFAQSAGRSNYQAGMVQVNHKTANGLTFMGNYTFLKNLSNAQGSDAPSAFAGEEPYAVEISNRFDLNYDRGNVVGNPRNRFLFTGTYELPYGTGRHWSGNGLMNALLGGWNISAVTLLQSGQWLTPTMNAAQDQSNTNLNNLRYLGGAVARPDLVGNPVPQHRTRLAYYDLNAFAFPPENAGRFGTSGLGILEGPGQINVNAGLAKVFAIKERYRLRFESSFTNVMNHANFAPPALNVSNPATFGVLTAVLPQGLGGNRTGQLALRLDF